MSDQSEPDDLDPQTVADIDEALAGVDTSAVDAAEAAIEHDVDALLAELSLIHI